MKNECLVFSTTPGLVPAAVSYILSRRCPQPSVGPLAPLLSLARHGVVPRPAIYSSPGARRCADRPTASPAPPPAGEATRVPRPATHTFPSLSSLMLLGSSPRIPVLVARTAG